MIEQRTPNTLRNGNNTMADTDAGIQLRMENRQNR